MARKPRPSVSEKRLFAEFPGAWTQLPGTRTYALAIGYGDVQLRFGKNAKSYLLFPNNGGFVRYESRDAMFSMLPNAVAGWALMPCAIGAHPAEVPEWAKSALKNEIQFRISARLADQQRLYRHLQNINLELRGLSHG